MVHCHATSTSLPSVTGSVSLIHSISVINWINSLVLWAEFLKDGQGCWERVQALVKKKSFRSPSKGGLAKNLYTNRKDWHPVAGWLLLLSVGLPVANVPEVLQPCGLLYYHWCSNSHHQSSPQEILAVRGRAINLIFDIPTVTTSRLPRDPSSQRWNYVGEKWPMNSAWNAWLPRSIQESFTCRKSTTWDRQLYFPSEGRSAEDFFALKNPTASAGFEPANLGTKSQHATSRPPKQLLWLHFVSPVPGKLSLPENIFIKRLKAYITAVKCDWSVM